MNFSKAFNAYLILNKLNIQLTQAKRYLYLFIKKKIQNALVVLTSDK